MSGIHESVIPSPGSSSTSTPTLWWERTSDGVARVLQIAVGALLLASAVGKLLDNRGFSEALLTYRLFPDGWLLEMGVAISLFELVLGLWILSGTRLSWSAIVAALLHLQFVVIATVSNLRGLDIPNCGCFGVFAARPMTWMTVAEDAGLFAMCLLIVWRARHLPAWVSVRIALARDT